MFSYIIYIFFLYSFFYFLFLFFLYLNGVNKKDVDDQNSLDINEFGWGERKEGLEEQNCRS